MVFTVAFGGSPRVRICFHFIRFLGFGLGLSNRPESRARARLTGSHSWLRSLVDEGGVGASKRRAVGSLQLGRVIAESHVNTWF